VAGGRPLAGDELLFAGLACVCVLLSAWPRALTLAAAAVLLAGWLPAVLDDRVLRRERSFFGTIQVHAFGENGRGRQLLHGTTRHGAQFDVGARPPEPTSYYHRSGPAAMAAEVVRRRGALSAAAVVGLGAGAMACHGAPGERWVFFEVDPEIARIAADPELFSYLRDCPPEPRVRIIDGRLGLARSASASLGLIVLDAFSSDAVPLHLLTRDAVAMYRSRLLPDGILAFHISNRYLDLEVPLGNVARELGLTCAYALDAPVDRRGQFIAGKQYSEWVFMAADEGALGRLADWPRCMTDPSQRTWSDEFADIWSALKWDALD
jgi:spermidine synthase